MEDEGKVMTCGTFTEISGKIMRQMTLTWDISLQKYVFIGMANNCISMWQSISGLGGGQTHCFVVLFQYILLRALSRTPGRL